MPAACSSSGGSRSASSTSSTSTSTSTTASPAPSTSTSVPATSSSTARPPATAAGGRSTTSVTPAEVTVRGVVAGTFASARAISLVSAVQGFTDIAVTGETEIRRADGRAATLGDVEAGATVEATGRLGSATSLVARRVVIVS